jgi:hypothetical protein
VDKIFKDLLSNDEDDRRRGHLKNSSCLFESVEHEKSFIVRFNNEAKDNREMLELQIEADK